MPVLVTGIHAAPPIDRFRRSSVGARAHVQWAPLRRWNNVMAVTSTAMTWRGPAAETRDSGFTRWQTTANAIRAQYPALKR